MPNSYATVPNILPGNVTIGGNLTVGGDQIRIGVSTPYCRVGKRAAAVAAISHNYDLITGANDLGQFNLYLDMVAAAGNPLSGRWHDGVGGQNFYHVPMEFLQTGVQATFTGSTVETDVLQQTIRGGFLQLFGGVNLRCFFIGNVQGGVATTFRIKIGATTVRTYTKAALANIIAEMFFANANSQAVQNGWSLIVDSVAGALPGAVGANIDTSLSFDVAVTIQLGAATDSWTVSGRNIDYAATGNF